MNIDTQEKIICRYLLGDLPEAERLALEQEFFADDETFEQVWAVENDLIDRYVRGRLTPVDKELFEKNYLASPVHRERLDFSRTLIQTADSSALPQTPPSENRQSLPWWMAFTQLFRGNLMPLGMAAMMVLLIIGGIWLFTERARLRNQMNQLEDAKKTEQQRREELEKKIETERQRREELASELDRLRQQQQTKPEGEPATPPPPDAAEPRSVVSLLLSPMILRGGDEAPPLKITQGIKEVRLQLKTQEAEARNFRASIRTVEGATIWNGTANRRSGAIVNVLVPAALLSTNDYILTLTATDSGSEPQEIGRYFFRVVK